MLIVMYFTVFKFITCPQWFPLCYILTLTCLVIHSFMFCAGDYNYVKIMLYMLQVKFDFTRL